MTKATDTAAPAVPELTIADLEKMLAAKKGEKAVEDFSEAKARAEQAGFATAIHPAHNGGSPALRIDY